MIKKVYGIYEGSIHEGGHVIRTLYTEKSTAIKKIEEIVKDLQREHDEVYGDEEPFMGLPYQWKEIEKGDWTNGLEVINVIEFEVK